MRDACLAQPTADNELAYADLLLDQKRLAEAEPALAALARNGQRLSAGQRQTLKDLLAGQALIRAEQARAAGQPRQADDILRQAALAAPDNPRLQRALAEGDMASGRWDAARAGWTRYWRRGRTTTKPAWRCWTRTSAPAGWVRPGPAPIFCRSRNRAGTPISC
ncbi:Uncharacterised protein [Chromobacterium violaceum]|uniref:Cellulose synthase operon protein C n=1 Tax=Chromobacterium violaceum TaxID=536 RepID=A0A447TEM2_CHRVL|nr:Uncharacterised protein [Chromobacterium violaceum]